VHDGTGCRGPHALLALAWSCGGTEDTEQAAREYYSRDALAAHLEEIATTRAAVDELIHAAGRRRAGSLFLIVHLQPSRFDHTLRDMEKKRSIRVTGYHGAEWLSKRIVKKASKKSRNRLKWHESCCSLSE
jgi:hypothetical protein